MFRLGGKKLNKAKRKEKERKRLLSEKEINNLTGTGPGDTSAVGHPGDSVMKTQPGDSI